MNSLAPASTLSTGTCLRRVALIFLSFMMLSMGALPGWSALRLHSLEAGGSYSDLDSGFDNWNRQYLSGTLQTDQRSGVYGSFERVHWFNETDFRGNAGIYGPLTGNLEGNLQFGASPTHEVAAQWWSQGTLSYWITGGSGIDWVELKGGGGFSDYEFADDATHLTGSLRFYRDAFWLGYVYTPYWLGGDGPADNHQLQFGYQPTIGWKWGAGFTFGETITETAAGQVQIVDVTALTAWGEQPFSDQTAITYSFTWQDIDEFYDRFQFQLGLKWAP